jgi:hypothetical protein
MSDSAMPGPSAARRRRVAMLRFLLLMTICCFGVYDAPLGVPGEPGDAAPDAIPCPCPECGRNAIKQLDDSYRCRNKHISRIENGSAKCEGSQAS